MGDLTLATRRKPEEAAAADLKDAASAAAGDTVAFERLYSRHVAHIHSMCRRMIGEEEADDVTQEVFVRLWRKLGQFRGDSAFSTWLYRLAVNLILGRRTVIGSYRSRFPGVDPSGLPVAGRRTTPELKMDFEVAIQQLPQGARNVFVLHDIEGYTHEEIGSMLEVTAGTSKSQLHRARMALREYFR